MALVPPSLAGRLARARRRARRHRRRVAAVLAAFAVLLLARQLSVPPPPTVAVWVAAHDLAAGAVVRASDLERRRFLPASVPDDPVADPRSVVGRTVTAPLTRGTPLTTSAVVGRPWRRALGGLSAVPVHLGDTAAAALLHVGDRVDVIGVDPQHPGSGSVIAPAALVLALPAAAGTTGEPSGSGADPLTTGTPVILGVAPDAAASVASLATTDYLTVVWSR